MCFRQITCCDPAIPSITFAHDEDMQPFDTYGKKRRDMIVQMDAVARKKACPCPKSDTLAKRRESVDALA